MTWAFASRWFLTSRVDARPIASYARPENHEIGSLEQSDAMCLVVSNMHPHRPLRTQKFPNLQTSGRGLGIDAIIATFIWPKVDSTNDNKVPITADHDFTHCYGTPGGHTDFPQIPDESIHDAYNNEAEDGRRFRDRLLKKDGKNSLREDRPTVWYLITDPNGVEVCRIHDDEREANCSLGREKMASLIEDGELIWKRRPTSDKTGERWATRGSRQPLLWSSKVP